LPGIAGDRDKLSMPVVSPEVLKGATVGEYVSLELDVQGKVVKILQLAPALRRRKGLSWAPDQCCS